MKTFGLAGWVLAAAATLVIVSYMQTQERDQQSTASVIVRGANDSETAMALRAGNAVMRCYQEMNIKIPDPVVPTVIVVNEIPRHVIPYDGACGAFEKRTNRLYVLNMHAIAQAGMSFYGAEISDDTYFSILVHEFAHFFNSQARPSMGYLTDEYVASVIQFDLMEQDTKASIIGYASKNYLQEPITYSLYRRSPEEFRILAYIYHMQNSNYLEQCISSIDFFNMF